MHRIDRRTAADHLGGRPAGRGGKNWRIGNIYKPGVNGNLQERVGAGPESAVAAKPRWQRLRPWVTAVFFSLIAAAIVYGARRIDWPQVLSALGHIPPSRLLLAVILSSTSYAAYSCVDLFAFGYMEGRVSRPRSMAIAFVSYAFNQSFGSLLGSIGFRFRLYSHHGLGGGAIAHIVGIGFLTNWSGYILLGGIAFTAQALDLPPAWKLGNAGLHLAGAVMLALVLGYVVACFVAVRRNWTLFGLTLNLPPWRTALVQLALSTFIWLAIAGTVYTFLQDGAGPLSILTVFLLASITGLLTHVPGGLGVIEAVFFALLGSRYQSHELMAGLLAYRTVYYIWPLLPAVILYAWLEINPPKLADHQAPLAPTPR